MIIKKSQDSFLPESAEIIAILAYESEPENLLLDPLKGEMRDFCRRQVVADGFKGKPGTSMTVPVLDKTVRCVVICGIGKKDSDSIDSLREGAFTAAHFASVKGAKSVVLFLPTPEDKNRSCAAAEGAVLGCYRFDKYITKEEDDRFSSPTEFTVIDGNEDGLHLGNILGLSQCYTRDIANEPGNIVTPSVLADKASELALEHGLECVVWDEDRVAQENMGAYSAVASGSANPPRFICLTYNPKEESKGHFVFVGKGLTFDSGGLDIKPAEFMTTMKGDKSGACAVLGAIKGIAMLELPYKVTVIVAAAENMPGGKAYRPDDILRARNGKTIEVNNTDAEGRLTLADALCYACELKPDAIIDIATLTGACAVALGSTTAGLFTNNEVLGDEVLSAAKSCGERFWKLPMDDPNLRKAIKSPYADLVNSAGRYGGAITAAMFLEEFVADSIPWVHLDIAAADFISKPWSYYVKGASGFGTRTLISFMIRK